jgi:hypothetical protein
MWYGALRDAVVSIRCRRPASRPVNGDRTSLSRKVSTQRHLKWIAGVPYLSMPRFSRFFSCGEHQGPISGPVSMIHVLNGERRQDASLISAAGCDMLGHCLFCA